MLTVAMVAGAATTRAAPDSAPARQPTVATTQTHAAARIVVWSRFRGIHHLREGAGRDMIEPRRCVALERQVDEEREDAVLVRVFLEEREAEVEADGGRADLGDVEPDADAGRD